MPSSLRPNATRSRLTTRERQWGMAMRSEEHTSELQSRLHLVCRLLLEKKKHQRLHRLPLRPTAPPGKPLNLLYAPPAAPDTVPARTQPELLHDDRTQARGCRSVPVRTP